MKNIRLKIAAGICCLLLAIPLAGIWWLQNSPAHEWRLRLVQLKLLGALPQESWSRVIQRISPNRLRTGAVPAAFDNLRIQLVFDSQEDLAEGERLFRQHCNHCHGAGHEGQLAPDLTSAAFQSRAEDSAVYLAIAQGIEGTSMPAFGGSPSEALQLAAYVGSLGEDSSSHDDDIPASVSRGGCARCEAIDVTYEALRDASKNSDQWLTYSGSYKGQHYSNLQQINHETISRLRPRWLYQMKSLEGVQTTPLVVDGIMILTGPQNQVIALDAGTGEAMWAFNRVVPRGVSLCCGTRNRGVAILGKRVYHAALDGHLFALDIATGRPIWDVVVADPAEGYSLTGAPLAVKDKIIVGMAGGDFGVRGFLDAYDAETGERVWRFHTIPGPGEPGHETWENDAWETGGGATWVTGSFDPDLNLLYWGVGNPAPTNDADYRPGDNLYTCSVIALDPDTGELKWHYQFNPHDANDWDAGSVPILADLDYEGQPRKLMLWANRNCFFYILDRETGKFLQANEYCEQNWNDGFAGNGRPIRRPEAYPTEEGTAILPSTVGGSNWYTPAYSPRTELYYVTYRLMDEVLHKNNDERVLGTMFSRGWTSLPRGGRNKGGLKAIHGATGAVAWDMMFDGLAAKSGLLATASDLLFVVDREGILYALAAGTGKEVWRMRLGGDVQMGPITYLHEGKQQLAVIANGVVLAMDLDD